MVLRSPAICLTAVFVLCFLLTLGLFSLYNFGLHLRVHKETLKVKFWNDDSFIFTERIGKAVSLAIDDYNEALFEFNPSQHGLKLVKGEDEAHVTVGLKCKREDHCVSLVPSVEFMASSYLRLLETLNNKTVTIVPVLRNEPDSNIFFQKINEMAIASNKGVKFTTPVVYEASKFPKSDAMQIISFIGARTAVRDIGSQIAVFLISSEELPHIINVIGMNKRLTRFRWFACDGLRYGNWLNDHEHANDFASKVSLTTLSFIGLEDSKYKDFQDELIRKEEIKANRDSFFMEVLSYFTTINIHQHFLKSMEFPVLNESKLKLGGFVYKDIRVNRFDVIPRIGWIPIGIGNDEDFNRTYTHPLLRSEVEKVAHKCENGPEISIWMNEGMLTPETFIKYNYPDMPDLVSIPANGGVSIAVDCDEKRVVRGCVPSKYDVGDLICSVDLGREKRSVKTSKWADWKKTSKTLQKLLPSFMGCGGSVAGCDFCLYFLSTYNLTASPAACVGGCSLGTFGSCSSLLGSSLVDTLFK